MRAASSLLSVTFMLTESSQFLVLHSHTSTALNLAGGTVNPLLGNRIASARLTGPSGVIFDWIENRNVASTWPTGDISGQLAAGSYTLRIESNSAAGSPGGRGTVASTALLTLIVPARAASSPQRPSGWRLAHVGLLGRSPRMERAWRSRSTRSRPRSCSRRAGRGSTLRPRAALAGANLDHELSRTPGVRFLVHVLPRRNNGTFTTPSECAEELIEHIEDFKALYLSSQPAGTPFPGYGIRLPGLGGAYAYRDYARLLPFASHHPDDALDQYVDAFTFSPDSLQEPSNGLVTDIGGPSPTSFRVAGGTVMGRPTNGLKHNYIKFTSGALASDPIKIVKTWEDNTITLIDGDSFSAAPAEGDECKFWTDVPVPVCYRFTAARAELATWADAFFDAIDANWPPGLEKPEQVALTTENIGEPANGWGPMYTFLSEYLTDEAGLDERDRDRLVPGQSLTAWVEEWGKDLEGTTIDPDTAPAGTTGSRSPVAQDQRSLAYGAFVVGLAWTWQLAFVDRMKKTWPDCRFVQYQLHSGTRSSPVRMNPGELFYHGEPWPPDVGHSHDEYYDIFTFGNYPSAISYTGEVGSLASTASFKVSVGFPFNTVSTWGSDHLDQLRFSPATPTTALQNVPATITGWNGEIVNCSTLPTAPATGDKFNGYAETGTYQQWDSVDEVGWGIWKAYEALYLHAGTLEERYRKTCISWVTEVAQRLTAAWPKNDVSPFIARAGKSRGRTPLLTKHCIPRAGSRSRQESSRVRIGS